MTFRNILYEKLDGIGTITLNRPNKLNALNFELLDELWAVLQEISGDDGVRVVLLTGSGRYFSAGADLEILSTLTPHNFRLNQRLYWNRVFNELEEIQKVTIAALDGPAIGGGLELALCCDLRYATEDAYFRMPQINFGLLPDAGGTVRLPLLIGLARAKEFILSGNSMETDEAEATGLINKVFPSEVFKIEIKKIAIAMAQKPPLASGIGKQLLNRSFQQRDIKSGLEDITDLQSYLITTEDYQEGINSFMEKRNPVFKGK